MNIALIRLELLRIGRSGAAKSILLFALVASLYAVWSGINWRSAHSQTLASYEKHIEAEQQAWFQTLTDIEAGKGNPSPYDARPMNIQLPATKPVGPLGHMAIGHAELMPSRVKISPWRNQMSMVEPYEFDNPTTLMLGRFDLAFFTVVILPLLMIAFSFDVIAADRARGTVRLLLSNPVNSKTIIASRLLVRNGLLLLVATIATVIGFSFSGANTIGYSLLWLATTLVYSLFWFALIYLIVSFIKRSETAVATLISFWAIFTLAIPALMGSAGEALYPQPSKLEYLSDARVAQNRANKETAELTKGFLADHPDLTVGDENVPSYFRGVFLANEQVLINTAPVVKAFEDSISDRNTFLDKLQYVSPAVITQRALFKIAGSDFEQAQLFLKNASETLDDLSIQVRSAILSRNRITTEQYNSLPKFEYTAAPTASVFAQISLPILILALMSMGLGILANRKSNIDQV
ncbi:MAG: ABC transporter permease subunit [Kordiimonas sp.]